MYMDFIYIVFIFSKTPLILSLIHFLFINIGDIFHATKHSSQTSWLNHTLFDQPSTVGMLDVSNNYGIS